MVSALYPSFLKLGLDGDIDLLVDTIKIVAVDTADATFSSAHDNLDDVIAGSRIGLTGAFVTKTTTSGVFDSDSGVIPSATGDMFEAIPNGNNINMNLNASSWFAL